MGAKPACQTHRLVVIEGAVPDPGQDALLPQTVLSSGMGALVNACLCQCRLASSLHAGQACPAPCIGPLESSLIDKPPPVVYS